MKKGNLTTELNPKCLTEKQDAFGLTNRGELIPCCWADTQSNDEYEPFWQLTQVSKIEDFNSIEEILEQDEWKNFYKDLMNNKGLPICHWVCRKGAEEKQQAQIIYKPDGTIKERKK